MPDYLPCNDSDLVNWLTNFNTTAGQNLAALHLEAADLAELAGALATFEPAVSAVAAAQRAVSVAVATKKAERLKAESAVRAVAQRVRAQRGIPDNLKISLGLRAPSAAKGPPTPMQPQGLVVNGLTDGTHRLKWDPNGNPPGILYRIDAQVGVAPEWQFVDVSTRTRFEHTGNRPGVRIAYRVSARRNGVTGEPSNEAIIYDLAVAA